MNAVAVDAGVTYTIKLHDIENAGTVTVTLDGDVRQIIPHLPDMIRAACDGSTNG